MTVRAAPMLGIIVLLLSAGATAGTKPPDETPQALLARAQASLIDWTQAGPVTLRYDVRLSDGRTGSYVWRRRDAATFREDLRIGQTSASAGESDGVGWRSPDTVDLETDWAVSRVMDFHSAFSPEGAGQLTTELKNVDGVDYVEVRNKPSEVTNPWAALLTWPKLYPSLIRTDFESWAFSKWKELPGLGRFPAVARLYLDDQPAVDFTLVSGTNRVLDEAELAPPPDAARRPACLTSEPPRLATRISPVYPEDARLARAQGVVVVRAKIGIDGAVTDVQGVRGPRTSMTVSKKSRGLLIDAAIAAVSRWKYDPMICNGKPVATDLFVTVRFHLS